MIASLEVYQAGNCYIYTYGSFSFVSLSAASISMAVIKPVTSRPITRAKNHSWRICKVERPIRPTKASNIKHAWKVYVPNPYWYRVAYIPNYFLLFFRCQLGARTSQQFAISFSSWKLKKTLSGPCRFQKKGHTNAQANFYSLEVGDDTLHQSPRTRPILTTGGIYSGHALSN